MPIPDTRTPEQIQADLERSKEALKEAGDQLLAGLADALGIEEETGPCPS